MRFPHGDFNEKVQRLHPDSYRWRVFAKPIVVHFIRLFYELEDGKSLHYVTPESCKRGHNTVSRHCSHSHQISRSGMQPSLRDLIFLVSLHSCALAESRHTTAHCAVNWTLNCSAGNLRACAGIHNFENSRGDAITRESCKRKTSIVYISFSFLTSPMFLFK